LLACHPAQLRGEAAGPGAGLIAPENQRHRQDAGSWPPPRPSLSLDPSQAECRQHRERQESAASLAANGGSQPLHRAAATQTELDNLSAVSALADRIFDCKIFGAPPGAAHPCLVRKPAITRSEHHPATSEWRIPNCHPIPLTNIRASICELAISQGHLTLVTLSNLGAVLSKFSVVLSLLPRMLTGDGLSVDLAGAAFGAGRCGLAGVNPGRSSKDPRPARSGAGGGQPRTLPVPPGRARTRTGASPPSQGAVGPCPCASSETTSQRT